MLLIAVHSIPQARPATTQDSSAMVSAGGVCIANSGTASAHSGRRKPATVHASATGSRQQDRRPRRAEHGGHGPASHARKSVGEGQGGAERLGLGGRRTIKKKNNKTPT